MEIIDAIKNVQLKENISLNIRLKALHDLEYLMKQLNIFLISYLHDMYKGIIPEFVYNCILESTLLNIRRLYEFFFYFEIKEDAIKQNNKLIIREDVFAEYFFPKIEDWYKLKEENHIEFYSLNNTVDKKFGLDKRAIHFTFNKKKDWKYAVPIIGELQKIYDIFKKNNMFDKNEKPNTIESKDELFKLINTNYHSGDIKKNEENEVDIKILELINEVYYITKLQNYGIKSDNGKKIVEGEG